MVPSSTNDLNKESAVNVIFAIKRSNDASYLNISILSGTFTHWIVRNKKNNKNRIILFVFIVNFIIVSPLILIFILSYQYNNTQIVKKQMIFITLPSFPQGHVPHLRLIDIRVLGERGKVIIFRKINKYLNGN